MVRNMWVVWSPEWVSGGEYIYIGGMVTRIGQWWGMCWRYGHQSRSVVGDMWMAWSPE